MKIVRFSANGGSPRLGMLRDDTVVDLQASYSASLARRGVTRAADLAAAVLPASTRAFLENGPVSPRAERPAAAVAAAVALFALHAAGGSTISMALRSAQYDIASL